MRHTGNSNNGISRVDATRRNEGVLQRPNQGLIIGCIVCRHAKNSI
jgi:hypothetical protein